MKAFHHKQPFGPDGNVHASSVTRTMKGQSLDVWDMFTRESLQNSWDARDTSSHEDGVTFAIDYKNLTPEQIETVTHQVFGNDVEGLDELQCALDSGTLRLLTVSDSGTNGLRGPSVASAVTTNSDAPRDFDSFVRNIGRSDTKELKGGTYGFGKGVFFIVSRVSTILVYTRTVDEKSEPVNRFIAMANSSDFQSGGTLYTGRHWWGVKEQGYSGNNITEYAEPFIGEAADQLAHALGMDEYFTEERTTGTCIAVIEPDIDDVDEGLANIAGSLTRWSWPHMVRLETNMDPIDFRVRNDGANVTIPNPETDPALRYFIQAYKEALGTPKDLNNTWKSSFRARSTRIWAQRPRKELGRLAVINTQQLIPNEETVLQQDIEHEIALLRSPRMVVEYWNGPRNIAGISYCGVFLADEEADPVFARSEPAAHHEWNHQAIQHDHELLQAFWGMESRANPVKILKDRMRALLKEAGAAATVSGDEKHYQSLTQMSKRLGSIVSNMVGGTDTRIPKMKPKNQNPVVMISGKNPTYTYQLANSFLHADSIYAVFKVDFAVPHDKLPVKASGESFIATDRGSLDEKQANEVGIEFPSIIGWSSSSINDLNSIQEDSEVLNLESTASTFHFCVRQPADTAVGLKFSFSDNEASTK